MKNNNQVIIPDSILKDAESMMDFLFFMDKDHANYEEMSIVNGLTQGAYFNDFKMMSILEDQVRWIVSMENKDQISSIEDGQGFVDHFIQIKLSDEFSRLIQETLTESEFQDVLRLNGNDHSCHTHDFCDSNQVMLDAMENLGITYDGSDSSNDLINEAWNISHRNNFSIKGE